MAKNDAGVPTTWLHLKAPVELFERLDRWREQQATGPVVPSRPAAIRWIVHQFLIKQEQRAGRKVRHK